MSSNICRVKVAFLGQEADKCDGGQDIRQTHLKEITRRLVNDDDEREPSGLCDLAQERNNLECRLRVKS